MVQGSFFDPPAVGVGGYDDLAAVRASALGCTRCGLATGRRQVVFGEGDPAARLLVVGEGPSESDDAGGHPFSGPSGRLLDVWLEALGLGRADIWLTNVVKCRPARPERGRLVNRPPTAGELAACRPWLELELTFVRPAVILGLGASAGRTLAGKEFKITQGRGQWLAGPGGLPTLVTFNPAYLMRLEEPQLGQAEAAVAADLAAVRARLADAAATPPA